MEPPRTLNHPRLLVRTLTNFVSPQTLFPTPNLLLPPPVNPILRKHTSKRTTFSPPRARQTTLDQRLSKKRIFDVVQDRPPSQRPNSKPPPVIDLTRTSRTSRNLENTPGALLRTRNTQIYHHTEWPLDNTDDNTASPPRQQGRMIPRLALQHAVQAASFEATHEQRRSPARLFDADLRVSALVGRVLFARVCPGRSLRDHPGWDLRSPRGPFGSLSK
jgi:hypothetical protein